MNRNVFLALGVAAVVGAGALFFTQQSVDPIGPALAQSTDAADVDTSGVKAMILGDEDAAISVVEYASFTCPHCKTFHENAFKQIKSEYIDTGKIKFEMREVYFDRFGLWAGMVARCDGGSRYFGIVDLIFENQREWTQGDPAQIAQNLRKFGKQAGMNDETLDACLQDGEKAQALVAVYQENAENDGIRSTPSFVINGEMHSNMSFADFKKILDDALGES